MKDKIGSHSFYLSNFLMFGSVMFQPIYFILCYVLFYRKYASRYRSLNPVVFLSFPILFDSTFCWVKTFSAFSFEKVRNLVLQALPACVNINKVKSKVTKGQRKLYSSLTYFPVFFFIFFSNFCFILSLLPLYLLE